MCCIIEREEVLIQAERRGRSSEVLPGFYSYSWLHEEREVLVWSNGDGWLIRTELVMLVTVASFGTVADFTLLKKHFLMY